MRVNKHNPIANKTRNRNRFDTFKRGVFFFPSRSSGTSHSSRKSCNDNLRCIPNPSHKYLVVLFPDSAAWKNGVFFRISLDSTQTQGHTGQTYCSSMTLFANRLSFVLRTVYSKKRDFVYFFITYFVLSPHSKECKNKPFGLDITELLPLFGCV